MRYWLLILFCFTLFSTSFAKKPKITGQKNLTVVQGQSITIQLSDLIVDEDEGPGGPGGPGPGGPGPGGPGNNDENQSAYPDGYTLEVFDGNNYSVSGTTVTPSPDFNGLLTVQVRVLKGPEDSKKYDLQVVVLADENVPPEITGQVALSTPENTPIAIQLSDLSVSDPDNTYPDGFTLSVSDGTNYTVNGTTVTPASGFSGTLDVPVTVNDGTSDSAPFTLHVTVEAHVNVAPDITGQVVLSIAENTSLTLQLSHLTVSDPDNTYPTGFTLHVSAGTNYVANGNTITPAAGFSGTLSIPVTVDDGTDSSAPFDVTVTVEAHVNTPPEITGQVALSTAENTPITIKFSDLVVKDPDNTYPSGFTLQLATGTNYSVNGAVITPANGFSGSLDVPVTVNDGSSSSKPFTLKITVNPHVNVAPKITGQTVLTTVENTPITIQLSNLTVSDPDNVYPTGFTLNLSTGTGYSVSGAAITPGPDFTGTLSVPVTVNDGTSSSEPFILKITVTPHVNVVPRITGQLPLSIFKNESLLIELSQLTIVDPDNSYPEDFSLSVIGGTNYSVSGDIVTPSLNFTGVLLVKVSVNDGAAESTPFNLRISVAESNVNQPPVITGQVGLTTFKNEPLTIKLSQLVVSDPDNTYPTGFKFKILPGNNYTFLGAVVRPTPTFIGTLTVNVTVNDGTSDSPVFPLKIEVIDKGELQIIGQVALTIEEDSMLTVLLTHLIVNDTKNTYPAGFSLALLPGEHYTFTGQTVVPAPDFAGNLTVGVTVSNGVNTSGPFNLLIVVTPVNDLPRLTQLSASPIPYTLGNGPAAIAENVVIADVDDEYLQLAEISFGTDAYQVGNDELIFASTENIRGVFDEQEGILSLIGRASLTEYAAALRSVMYNFNSAGDTLPSGPKMIYFLLNDGKNVSDRYQRGIEFPATSELDIPNAFTPNNDNANDTWDIMSSRQSSEFVNAIVRVYNRHGLLVYQANGLDKSWDGKFNGEVLPPDVYFYTIELNLPFGSKNYKGAVAILR